MTRPSTPGRRNVDRPSAIFSLLLVASVTEAMFLVLPSFVGALSDDLRMAPSRIGLLGSADLAGIALATATGPWWLRRLAWRRTVAWALGIFGIANSVCFGVSDFWLLLSLRIMAGMAAGTAYVVALAGIVDTRHATRNSGLLVCTQVVFAAAGLYALDAIRIAWRLDAVYAYVLAWTVPTFLYCWKYFPEDPGGRPVTQAVEWKQIGLAGAAALAGTCLYFLMIGGVWGYLEGVAREAGLTLPQIGTTLSLGLSISIIGPILAAWLGLRLGRTIPLIATAFAQLISLYLLIHLTAFTAVVLAFFIINTIFNIVWNYVIAYFITIFDEIDPSGRFVALYGTASHASLAVGPFAGALIISDGHYAPLLRFGIVAVAASFALFLVAVQLTRSAATESAVTVDVGSQ
jgi:MFS transporter, DHA1 family, inner membrane transport protein